MSEIFIAYGVPRSGTTALAKLLNTHPSVFCGIERFPIDHLSRDLLTPAGVLDRSIPTAHYDRNLEYLRHKPQIVAFGDKTPRYYFSSRRLDKEIPELKRIVIVRELADVMSSWQARADNPDDRAWHRGQHGLFALLDHLVLVDSLGALKQPSNCFLCSYAGLFGGNRNREAVCEMFAFLGVNEFPGVEAYFDQTRNLRKQLAARKRLIGQGERELVVESGFDRLARFIDARGGFVTLDHFVEPLNQIKTETPTLLAHLTASIDHRLSANPDSLAYLTLVLRRMYSLDRNNLIFTADRESFADGFRECVEYTESSLTADHSAASRWAENLRQRFPKTQFRADEVDKSGRLSAPGTPGAIAGSLISGFIDSISGDTVTGWVAERNSSASLTVELRIDGEPVKRMVAELPRPGLKSKGIHQTGMCGFSFGLEQSLTSSQRVEVAVLPFGKILSKSPKTRDGRRAHAAPALKIFFLHIPKTAGSSLNDFIASHFPADRVRTHIEAGSDDGDPRVAEDFDFISGHVKAPSAKRWWNLDGFTWVTLFRDPWRQLASHLSWVRFIAEDPEGGFFKGHPRPIRDLAMQLQAIDYSNPDQLGEILFSNDHRVLTLFDNFQTRALIEMTPGRRVAYSDLKEALERLGWFDVIGTTEHYDDFIGRLCRLASWAIPPKPRRLNIQSKRFGLEIDNPETRKLLAPLVAHDLELYAFVRQATAT